MASIAEEDFTEHLRELTSRLKRIFIVFSIVLGIYLFPLNIVEFEGGENIDLSQALSDMIQSIANGNITIVGKGVENYRSLTTMFLNYSFTYLLPENAKVFIGSSIGVFTSILWTAALLSIITILPYATYEVLAFIWPGLYAHERRILKKYLAISWIYIAAGFILGFYITAYTIIRIGVAWGQSVGAEPWVQLQSFLSDLTTSILGTIALFIAPLALLIATELGLIDPDSEIFKNKKLIYAIAWVVIAFFMPDITTVVLLLIFILIYEPTFWYMKRIKKQKQWIDKTS